MASPKSISVQQLLIEQMYRMETTIKEMGANINELRVENAEMHALSKLVSELNVKVTALAAESIEFHASFRTVRIFRVWVLPLLASIILGLSMLGFKIDTPWAVKKEQPQ